MTLREIDALVAEHVMGWRNYKSNSTGLIYFLLPAALESEYMQSQVRSVDERGDENNAPSFTEDITAAWTVVEKLMEIGWTVTLAPRQFEKHPDDRFIFHGCRMPVDADGVQRMRSFSAHAETAPLAICKAALKVAGIDPDTGEKL